MTDAQLAFYSSWASIVGLCISVVSLFYVRSIKKNIIRFRRKQRIRHLTDEILQIQDDAMPLSSASRTKLLALKRNIPTYVWSRFTEKGRAALEVHKHIDEGNIVALKEAIYDLASFSEDA
ncbi:hypothetical protein NX774_18835 [Massilia agilis]|uniref:Uncharacterized protein n=1 Tax=Massilia agilis TaxID=1811226 RepID=A0ABT2DF79_9BURK|nr:hypothetical protein [Massilia agilis]MCS0809983.1 hypothetical protein [Massilia agilis]